MFSAIAGRIYLALSKREQDRRYKEDCRRKAMLYFLRDGWSRVKWVERRLKENAFNELEMVIVGCHANKHHYEAEMLQQQLDAYRKKHYL